MRVLLGMLVFVALCVCASSAMACNSVTPPPDLTVMNPDQLCTPTATTGGKVTAVVTKPMTRLHNVLLTQAPGEWWQAHKEEVLAQLQDDSRKHPQAVPEDIKNKLYQKHLGEISRQLQEGAVDDHGILREYIKYMYWSVPKPGVGSLTGMPVQQTQNVTAQEDITEYVPEEYLPETLQKLNHREMQPTQAKGALMVSHYDAASEPTRQIYNLMNENIQFYAKRYDARKKAREQWRVFNECLVMGMERLSPSQKLGMQQLISKAQGNAFSAIAHERALIEAMQQEVPEKVIADALFCIIYLNGDTLKELPKFNFEYFFDGFDGKQSGKYVYQARTILLDCGEAALPYLERAWVELQGYEWKEGVADAFDVSAVFDKARLGKLQRLADQRAKGGVLDPILEIPGVGTVKDDHRNAIDQGKQLIPLMLDFLEVFDRDYNTPFSRNDDASATLRQLYTEIARKAADNQ